jgi:hypothetical protein
LLKIDNMLTKAIAQLKMEISGVNDIDNENFSQGH